MYTIFFWLPQDAYSYRGMGWTKSRTIAMCPNVHADAHPPPMSHWKVGDDVIQCRGSVYQATEIAFCKIQAAHTDSKWDELTKTPAGRADIAHTWGKEIKTILTNALSELKVCEGEVGMKIQHVSRSLMELAVKPESTIISAEALESDICDYP
jgi:hypothetical protein